MLQGTLSVLDSWLVLPPTGASKVDLEFPKRFNPWRHWMPLHHRGDPNFFSAVNLRALTLASHEIAAVYQYRELTGVHGIEFVVVAAFVDAAPFRRLEGELWLVPCRNVLDAAFSEATIQTPANYLYDGWLPLADASDDTILNGLRKIDEVVATMAHVHQCPCRWLVKYAEYGNQRRHNARRLTDEDHDALLEQATKLESLPLPTRSAVARSMTWLDNSRQQARQSDRFLSLWLALESLLLALYDDADGLGLPVQDSYAGLTKNERKERRRTDIREVFATVADPIEATKRAYFECVGSVRRQTEAVLSALFGAENPVVIWPYSANEERASPAQIRADMVHRGMSGVEASRVTNLDRLSGELERIVQSAIERVLQRSWEGGPLSHRPKTFVASMYMDDQPLNLQGSPQLLVRPTEITPELLARKGLL